MRRFLALVAAILLLSAVEASAYDTYPELDATASWLAQRPVEVRCLSKHESENDINIWFWGASAYVEIVDNRPSDYAIFDHGLCEKLLAVHTDTWRGVYSFSAVAWAVMTLTHESGHLRGWGWWKNEAKVNCWALRHVRYTALQLGASADIAWGIRSWSVWWYRHQPPDYRRAGCAVPSP